MPDPLPIVVVGCGAAGLFAAIHAARALRGMRPVIAVDGASKLGAKILVAGGGRCNVTHHAVDEKAYAGSSPHAIRKVLLRFTVEDTRRFFADLGVHLKQEDTGKLFPTTDDGRDVLNALLRAARDAGVTLLHPWRAAAVRLDNTTFIIDRDPNAPSTPDAPTSLHAERLILATGGKSLPKTGSDGIGYTFAHALGHSLTSRITPALVPLTLPRDHWLCSLSGVTIPAAIELRSAGGKLLARFVNSTLLTHFGLSGPAILDISRYWTHAHADDPSVTLSANFLAGLPPETLDALLLRDKGLSIARWLCEKAPHAATVPGHESLGMPDRLARALCAAARVDPSTLVNLLTRDQRRALVDVVTRLPLPATGDRGYLFAEVTAGGVPLSELNLSTMESRVTPHLHLCGELCDVDGRIGGFNFQWAWASGFLAGSSAAAGVSA